jgi:hypothetical protein
MEALIAVGGLMLILFLLVLALGKWYPGTGAEQLDWKPTRSYEDEVQLELDDIDQMLEAQNERRRRSGRPEITEEQVRAEVSAEERAMEERRETLQRENAGSGGEATPPPEPRPPDRPPSPGSSPPAAG